MNDEAIRVDALGQGQQFIKSLMNATVDPIPNSNGMSVVRGLFDLESGVTHDIILRNITIPFWQVCLDVVNRPNARVRVAAIGNPGIGKTVSTPWLIRMLLDKGKTVVYLIRTTDRSSWYYEFIPESDRVTTKIYPETLPEDDIPNLELKSSYYIVDPGRTKDDCSPEADFQAKTIIVPSLHSGQWGESNFTKNRGSVYGTFRCFPTWSYEELVHARSILRPDMTEDQVRERFRQFGGVPRHVFAWKIDGALQAQDRAISSLTAERATMIGLGHMFAYDKYGKEPKSALLAFRLSALVIAHSAASLWNASSPQYHAFKWRANSTEDAATTTFLASMPFDIIKERYILAVLYYSTNGRKWYSTSRVINVTTNPFLSGGNVCNRIYYLKCGPDNLTQALTLRSYTGPAPSNLGKISSLTYLDL